jgi:hypothetical protein
MMSFPQPFLFGKRLQEGQSLDEVLGSPVWTTTAALTATTGGSRTTSTRIVESVANIATAASGAGVTLPVAVPGKIMLVFNNSANDIRIFADDPSMIDGVTGDVGILQRPNSVALFVAQTLRMWSYSIFPISTSVLSDYISAYDTTIQINASTAAENIITINTTDSASGISIVDGSKITVSRTGVYNLQFSAQFDKTDSGQDTFDLWLKKNTQPVSWSNTTVDANNNNAKVVAAWNFVMPLVAGDFLQLAWWSSDAAMRVFATAAQAAVPGVSPALPAIPSVIITMTGV